MIYEIQHIPKDTAYNRRPGIAMDPDYITIHSTGNLKSTAQNERDWLVNISNTRNASWHIVVDENAAIEAIPTFEIAWHAGDGKFGTGNRKSISIEICESGNRLKTLENAAKLSAKLLYEKGWGIERLKRHYDWNSKLCPRIFADNGWEGWHRFKNMVSYELEQLSISYWAKDAVDWATSPDVNITDASLLKEPVTLERMITILYRYDKLRNNK